MHEEIGLDLEQGQVGLFTHFEFDLRPIGKDRYFRSYYEVRIPIAALHHLTLHEGADMQAFNGDEALSLRLSPYDGFALLLHHQHA